MHSVIELSHVTVVLDEKPVLDDLSWRVKKGENWAIIGPNGAGKTTLLSIINGYRWPTEGTVRILGKSFGSTDLRELRKEIGIVSSYLDAWIPRNERVLDLVLSGKHASVRLWKRARESDVNYAESLLKLMDCFECRDRRMANISQGERQRVLIARAMMAKPKLLTLDEPCEGLDLKAREDFLDGLGKISASGEPTIIDVTHRTDEIPRGFSHALVLKNGKALAQGQIGGVLTSKFLNACFGVRVKVHRFGGRFYTIVDHG